MRDLLISYYWNPKLKQEKQRLGKISAKFQGHTEQTKQRKGKLKSLRLVPLTFFDNFQPVSLSSYLTNRKKHFTGTL